MYLVILPALNFDPNSLFHRVLLKIPFLHIISANSNVTVKKQKTLTAFFYNFRDAFYAYKMFQGCPWKVKDNKYKMIVRCTTLCCVFFKPQKQKTKEETKNKIEQEQKVTASDYGERNKRS